MAESTTPSTPSATHFVSDSALAADQKFNEAIFKTVSYSLSGLGLGVLASVFFRNKARVILFSSGIGTGWGFHEFSRSLAAHK